MINYLQAEGHMKVRWKKKELGRIYTDAGLWWYIPRGCTMDYAAVRWNDIGPLKHDLEN